MPPLPAESKSNIPRFIIVFLVLACVAVYAQVWHFQFVNFDDEDYIYSNPHVLAGLNWQTISWAFTTGYDSNYHPLTWISLALDVSVYGVRPGWFHLENLLFHIFNSLLLLRFLHRATGNRWLSVFAAFVFALHPTHVESVAWVTERKDTLSTFFLLLTMLSYLRFVQLSAVRSYFLAGLFFMLSLLSKQMGVTLPVILLLLDYWPLQRGSIGIRKLLIEKLPLLCIAAAASAAIVIAQDRSGAIATLKGLPLGYRLQNIPIAYCIYLRQTFWPAGLCVFYPYRIDYTILQSIAACFLLVVITAICWRRRRKAPYLLVGWLWFVIMLTPVIGLVQVGSTMTADRYLYMPSVGLSLMFAGAIQQWIERRNSSGLKRLATAGAISLVAALGIAAYIQTQYWRNTLTLFTRALTQINQGAFAHMQLAKLYLSEHDPVTARRHYLIAAQLAPDDFTPEYDLGNLTLDNPPEAISHYQRALALQPGNAQVENNLAIALIRAGQPVEAEQVFRAAIAHDPAYLDAHLNLARLLDSTGKRSEARVEYQQALKLAPTNATARAGAER